MTNYVPDQGDIIRINLTPSSGKEMHSFHPAYVISLKLFNQKTGFAIIAPITSTVRNLPFEIPLSGTGTTTRGAIYVHQLKSVDYVARMAEFVESSPHELRAEVYKLFVVFTAYKAPE